MNTHDWHNRLLILLQVGFCFALGVAPAGRGLALILLVVCSLPFRIRLTPLVHGLVIGGGSLLYGYFAIRRFIGHTDFEYLQLFEVFAECLLIIQAFELMRRRGCEFTDRLAHNYLPGLATLTLVALLIYRGSFFGNTSLTTLFMAWNVMMLLVMRPDWLILVRRDSRSRRKVTALIIVFLVSTASGSLLAPLLSRYAFSAQLAIGGFRKEGDPQRLRGNNSRASFVDHVDLASIERKRLASPDELVFQVESNEPPGYMRTLSFEYFNGVEWSNPWSSNRRLSELTNKRIAPETKNPVGLSSFTLPSGYLLFSIPYRDAGKLTKQQIKVPEGTGRLVPIPLNCAFIAATQETRTKQLVMDVHGNVLPSAIDNSRYVTIAGARNTWEVNEAYLERLKQLPESDAVYLAGIAAQVASANLSTADKIQRVTDHFNRNFQYSLETEATVVGKRKLTMRQFLDERRAAHCEYFATATALILRALDVPCRLSTGYLVYETDADDNYYVARNRHAHAWVEAYDDSREQWLLVEATPGINQYVGRFQQTQLAAQDNQVEGDSNQTARVGLWAKLSYTVEKYWRSFLFGKYGWIVSLAFAGLLAQALRVKSLRSQRRAARLSPAVKKSDRRAKAFGYIRQPYETCLQFALRLDQSGQPELMNLAGWYRQHSQERYAQWP